MRKQNATARRKILSAMLAIIYAAWTAQAAAGYAFNQLVPDVRQPVSLSGGSACPVRAHQLTAASSIAVRWSTTLGTSPVSILTQDQTATALPASWPSLASSPPTPSANSSAAAPPPRSSAKFSTPTFISIPLTRKSLSQRPPPCLPLPIPTTSHPSSPTSSAIFSASAIPPSGAP